MRKVATIRIDKPVEVSCNTCFHNKYALRDFRFCKINREFDCPYDDYSSWKYLIDGAEVVAIEYIAEVDE